MYGDKKIRLTEQDIEKMEDGFTIIKQYKDLLIPISYCGHKGEIKNGTCLECGDNL